jgi:hypothetical protein
MLSLFSAERLSAEPAAAEISAAGAADEIKVGIHFEDAAPKSDEGVRDEEAVDFEIVLGRRQLASVLFVATVVLVVFSALGYLAGKAIGPAPKTVIERVVETVPAPASTPVGAAAEKPEAPLFAEPKEKMLYLQMGAVEKGIAVVFAEGLRKKGFDAFVAPGPNDHIFRVLIGPMANEEAYQKTRKAAEDLELNTFARRFSTEDNSARPEEPARQP